MAKTKAKTRAAAKKRFVVVGRAGKRLFKRAKAYRRHLLTKKTPKQKRGLRSGGYVHEADIGRISRLLPYAS